VTTLDISNNPAISSYAPLATANVRTLYARANNITDLTPFLAISSLDNGGTLDVLENNLACATQKPHIEALRARGITVYEECIP
jgi:hypothetical protein